MAPSDPIAIAVRTGLPDNAQLGQVMNDVRSWWGRARVGVKICFPQPERSGSFSGGVRSLSAVLGDNFIGEATLLATIGFFGAIIAGFVR